MGKKLPPAASLSILSHRQGTGGWGGGRGEDERGEGEIGGGRGEDERGVGEIGGGGRGEDERGGR